MRALKWWLRIVGALYILEGVGLSAAALFDPGEFAAIWASAPIAALDDVAIRGIRIAGLPGVLTWALLGALMWIFSRAPGKAGTLVIVVAAWELLVWLPTDLVAFFNGFTLSRTIGLIAVHLIIGVSGLLLLRRAKIPAAS